MSRKQSLPPQTVRFYVVCYGIAAFMVAGILIVATLAARLTSALGWTH